MNILKLIAGLIFMGSEGNNNDENKETQTERSFL